MNNENKAMTSRGVKILLLTLLVLAIVVTVIIIVATSNNSTTTVTSSSSYSSSRGGTTSSMGGGSSSINSPSSSNDPTSSSGGGGSDVPTIKEIVFIIPVENGSILKEFTETTVVWNQTLGMYCGHMGIDIKGEENAKVLSAYDGKIKSITTSYLEGTTVVVDHSNGLESVYNSLEVNENLEVGDTVSQGDELGVISTNNRQEYKDGAHLHFEVKENGKVISPNKYLLGLEK